MLKNLHILLFLLLSAAMVNATPVKLVQPNFGTIRAVDEQGNPYLPREEAYDLPAGTRLTLYATNHDECSVFAQWIVQGDARIEGNTLQVGQQAVTVFARFQVVQYTIAAEVFPANAGSALVRCGVASIFLDVAGPVNCGSTVQLTAVDDNSTGMHFVQWDDGLKDRTRLVTADADRTYIAYFVEPDIQTAIDAASADQKPHARAFVRDGRLLIEHNGHLYNAQGQSLQ